MTTAAAPPDWIDRLASGWRAWALIALVALFGALPGVARLPVMDRDEARYAQATTQMLETGDFVRIYVQDNPRNKKPIGIYWLQAASVATFSDAEARAIWAYRLPSVLGAIVAALATFWAGLALVSRRTAFLGAALFAASLLIGFEGMTAKTDAALCAATTVALAALAHLYRAAARPWSSAFVFWIAVAVGVLIKGPVTPLVAALLVVTLGIWERRWNWAAALAWWPGPALAAALVLPWMIAIGIATNGAFFAEAIGVDLAPKLVGRAEGHSGPVGYYAALLSFLIFPVTIALPAALRLGWITMRAPASEPQPLRFLIAWIVPFFIVLELLPTKLAHYTLPAYPAIALLAAAGFAQAREAGWRKTQIAGVALFALVAAFLVAFNAYASMYMPGDAAADQRRMLQGALIGGALLLPALAALVLSRSMSVRLALALAIALTASYTLRQRTLPEARMLLASDEVSSALARAGVHPRLSTNAPPIWIVGYGETSLIFETRTDARIARPPEAAQHAAIGDVVVLETRMAPEFTAALAVRGLHLTPVEAPVHGLNYANGDDVELTVSRVAR